MATGLAVLERQKTEQDQESNLKAYGKLSGLAENQELTEDQKALRFNARISENYQRLINPEYTKAEEIAVAQPVYQQEAPVYTETAAPARARIADIFRADSPVYTNGMDFTATQANNYVAQDSVAETVSERMEESADLMPTSTTIQYRTDLFENEKQQVSEEKKGYALTAKGKLLMAVYALVVTVILALIIVNTSVLKTLDGQVEAKEAQLNSVTESYNSVMDEIEELTSEESIISRAEDIGMYMPD